MFAKSRANWEDYRQTCVASSEKNRFPRLFEIGVAIGSRARGPRPYGSVGN